jgi:hypothetical protein
MGLVFTRVHVHSTGNLRCCAGGRHELSEKDFLSKLTWWEGFKERAFVEACELALQDPCVRERVGAGVVREATLDQGKIKSLFKCGDFAVLVSRFDAEATDQDTHVDIGLKYDVFQVLRASRRG